jgi:16S rRNA C967 or C1407 C5-methylase (RsmB/RsmF family)/NOL1/NOP2/fmu family ribosome biogenesis protein
MQKIPTEFIKNIQSILGDEVHDFINSLETSQQPTIRWNTKKVNFENGKDIPWEKNAEIKAINTVFANDPLWHAGAYYVQESSSMFLGYVFQKLLLDKNPLIMLDLCASPGGKATQLLNLIHENSFLVANEIHPQRNVILRENLTKWGSPNCIVTQSDTRYFKKINEYFDAVVVDAPCTGEGLWRKNNEAIKEWSPKNIFMCANRQQEILADIAPSIKVGGYLIYSTCTFNTTENENQIQNLLDSKIFELVSIPHEFDEICSDKDYFYHHFYPHKTMGSGFFIAVLKKVRSLDYIETFNTKSFQFDYFKCPNFLEKFLKNSNEFTVLNENNEWIVLPKKMLEILFFLYPILKIKQKGIVLGKMLNKEKIIFDYSFALSNIINKLAFQKIELNLSEAISYLKKNDLQIVLADNIGEQALVYFENIPLGWVKILENKLKNQLPLDQRLRL